jgi:hypothetical protein
MILIIHIKDKNVYPNLKKEPENILSKEDVNKYLFELRDIVEI